MKYVLDGPYTNDVRNLDSELLSLDIDNLLQYCISQIELPDETFTSYVAKIKKNCMYSNHQTKNPTNSEIFW